jgi:hypothetical protein
MVIDDFKGADGLWVKTVCVGGSRHKKTSYGRWSSINSRCKSGGSTQNRRPTYIGCTSSSLFSSFERFTDWHTVQVGYNIKGYQIDKDILFKGNLVYSENTCVLVPPALNYFLVSNNSTRGKYPQGVAFNKLYGRFLSKISVGNKAVNLGFFDTIEEASAVYKVAKEAEAYRWYERLRDGEFIVDPRVTERMRTWTFEETV